MFGELSKKHYSGKREGGVVKVGKSVYKQQRMAIAEGHESGNQIKRQNTPTAQEKTTYITSDKGASTEQRKVAINGTSILIKPIERVVNRTTGFIRRGKPKMISDTSTKHS